MTVRKNKDGRWLCEIAGRKGVKRKRKIFKTKDEAEIFERNYLSSFGVQSQIDRLDDQRRLLVLITLWDQYIGVSLSDGEHRSRAMQKAVLEMGNPIASSVTPEHFVQYRFKRLQQVTPKTVNNLHGYLNALYNQLRRLDVINYDCPTCKVDMIKVHERELTYLSYGQIDLLLHDIASCCLNESTWYVTQLCLRTGARWGEAEQLKAKQLQDGRITYIFTKSKKIRSVPIDADFYKLLKKWAKGKNPEERLFTNCIGAYRRAVARIDLQLPKGQMTHVLRHSFASHYIMRGGNVLTLQKILGHSDIKMTMRYAHLSPDHLQSAIRLNPLNRE